MRNIMVINFYGNNNLKTKFLKWIENNEEALLFKLYKFHKKYSLFMNICVYEDLTQALNNAIGRFDRNSVLLFEIKTSTKIIKI